MKRVRLRLGDGGNVGGPANRRPAVRQRLPEQRVESLHRRTQWGGIIPHPAFLKNDVALRVKFAEDRMENPLRLQPHPELQLVGRHADEVGCHIVHRKRVHPVAAVGLVEFPDLIFDDDLAFLQDQGLKFLLQLPVTRRPVFRFLPIASAAAPPGRAHPGLLAAHGITDPLLFG